MYISAAFSAAAEAKRREFRRASDATNRPTCQRRCAWHTRTQLRLCARRTRVMRVTRTVAHTSHIICTRGVQWRHVPMTRVCARCPLFVCVRACARTHVRACVRVGARARTHSIASTASSEGLRGSGSDRHSNCGRNYRPGLVALVARTTHPQACLHDCA